MFRQVKGRYTILMLAIVLSGLSFADPPGTNTRLSGHAQHVTALAYSSQKNMIASGDDEGNVIIWDGRTKKAAKKFPVSSSGVQSVAISRNGRFLAVASDEGVVTKRSPMSGTVSITSLPGKTHVRCTIRELTTGKALAAIKAEEPICCVTFSPTEPILAGAGRSFLSLYSVPSGKEIARLDDFLSVPGQIIAFSPKESLLALATEAGDVRILHTPQLKDRIRLKGHSKTVTCVAWSPDGKVIASGGWDQDVRVWDCKTGKCLQTLPIGGKVKSLQFSPDSDTLAIGARQPPRDLLVPPGGEVTIWSIPRGKLVTSRGADVVAGVSCLSYLDNHQVAFGSFGSPDLLVWQLSK